MTYELQKQHTITDSQAGNWAAVASTLSAPVAQPAVKASSKRTFGALVQAGFDPDKIIAGFTATPSGAALIGKLNADPDGIDWSDSLTRYILEKLVAAGGDVTPIVATLLRELSARQTTLAYGASPTPEQCQADWEAGIDDDLKKRKQASLAEANDTAITLITDTPSVSKASLITAFTKRLNETWPA